MTNKDAFQSMTEYKNDNLLLKTMLDRGVVSVTVYDGSAASKQAIDLCAADLYMALATHPEIREGGLTLSYTGAQLQGMAKTIYKKYGENPKTIFGHYGDGNSLW